MVELVMLDKAHILSYIDYGTTGVQFACSSVFVELDDVQSRFICQLDFSL